MKYSRIILTIYVMVAFIAASTCATKPSFDTTGDSSSKQISNETNLYCDRYSEERFYAEENEPSVEEDYIDTEYSDTDDLDMENYENEEDDDEPLPAEVYSEDQIRRANLIEKVYYATKSRDLKCVKYLSQDGFDESDIRNFRSVKETMVESPVYLAIENGDLEIAEFLLKSGLNSSDSCCDAPTPLHGAIMYGYLELVKLMLTLGADLGKTCCGGLDAIDIAVREKKTGIEKMLRSYKVKNLKK